MGPGSGQSAGPAVRPSWATGLHVIEPELLLHVAIGHLAESLLVVLHELEDGSQLLFLNSVEKKAEEEKEAPTPAAREQACSCGEVGMEDGSLSSTAPTFAVRCKGKENEQ